jgi:heterodisulfide reductase subunit C
VRGYRGFLRELMRTGSLRALSLQLRTGTRHVLRQSLGRRRGDPVEEILASYGDDGVATPTPEARALALSAEACLVCGLCSFECARVGGRPALDPRDAVAAAARLQVDWRRLGVSLGSAGPCAGCDACTRICPAGIPVHRVQASLLGADATPDRIG